MVLKRGTRSSRLSPAQGTVGELVFSPAPERPRPGRQALRQGSEGRRRGWRPEDGATAPLFAPTRFMSPAWMIPHSRQSCSGVSHEKQHYVRCHSHAHLPTPTSTSANIQESCAAHLQRRLIF